jgi:P-type Cu2+ transporter
MSTIEKTKVVLPLSGVDSEHCALIADKGLDKVEGVLSHKVELNNHQAIIEAADEEAVAKAVSAIRNLGYDVDTVKKSFPVTGLSCASCAISVESMLKAELGVVDASVNFANSTANVEYIPGTANVQHFKKSIQDIGYDIIIEDTEEATEALEELQQKRYAALRTKTILSILFSIPLVVIGMFFMNMPYANYIMWALATPVVLIFGKQFFVNAYKQAKNRSANMDTLVALSTGIAYIFSVFNTVYPQFWHSRGLHAHVYFEAAAVVIAFILLGKLLEEKAKSNTSTAIKKLMGLQPKTVVRIAADGTEQTVNISSVQVADHLMVKPGEKIPVDGVVVSGSSFVDESMISGEPIPVQKEQDTKVFAGTINQKGSFVFKAEKVGKDTLLAHIIKTVQEAQGSKAPVQKLVDKIAGIFVPVVIAIAILSFIAWLILGGENALTQGLLAMVTVLVIACPCALGLATPTAIMVGVGRGAENGILIKDAESLEQAKNINAIILDKTGTITEGRPEVINIAWKEGVNNVEAASIFYSIEAQSEHPLAEAVVYYLKPQNLTKVALSSFESVTGAGVSVSYNNMHYYTGSFKMLQEKGVTIPAELQAKVDGWLNEAYTVIWFADATTALAAVAIADKIKSTSAQAIKQLQQKGIEVYMLTGDNAKTAAAVAAKVGIQHYRAETLPDDKAAFIKELQQQGKVVAMVGDGINDSHALAQADVSIAMGRGTDIAMDVAKMTLISSDLNHIPKAITLSRKTVQTIRQNLFWAFIYNLIGIPIAAGILYPFTGFMLNPMIAGAAMALSSVSVVTNSLRLKWARL